MMIKITEHCSMECTHCMNAATPNNVHMDFDTFKKAIRFQNTHGGSFMILTGGEPTEHPMFKDFLKYALENTRAIVTVTTNGVWMTEHYDDVSNLYDMYDKRLAWQVTSDKRYYPHLIDLSLPVFKIGNVMTFDKIGSPIYPIGRAKDMPSENKCSKCFNIRAITRQVSESTTLGIILGMMNVKGYFCTPHIAVNGDIKVGESDLCPPCSHIDKNEREIRQDILDFRCHKCDSINDKLPPEHKKLLGE